MEKTENCRAAILAAIMAAISTSALAVEQNGACQIVQPHPPGRTVFSIQSGGLERQYIIHVPNLPSAARPVALVFDLHASGISPDIQLAITGITDATDRRDFIVAALDTDGTDPTRLQHPTETVRVEPGSFESAARVLDKTYLRNTGSIRAHDF
jgi:poly(3-hydroxybutyrate) depolymerase